MAFKGYAMELRVADSAQKLLLLLKIDITEWVTFWRLPSVQLIEEMEKVISVASENLTNISLEQCAEEIYDPGNRIIWTRNVLGIK